MGWRQRRPLGHASLKFSCMRGESSSSSSSLLQHAHLTFFAFLPFPAFSPLLPFLPFPPSTSPSSPLSLALAFLDFAAPTSADDVARLRALAGDRLRPLRVAVVLDRVLCMSTWDGSSRRWRLSVVVVGVVGAVGDVGG
jgi:hypothetical protein